MLCSRFKVHHIHLFSEKRSPPLQPPLSTTWVCKCKIYPKYQITQGYKATQGPGLIRNRKDHLVAPWCLKKGRPQEQKSGLPASTPIPAPHSCQGQSLPELLTEKANVLTDSAFRPKLPNQASNTWKEQEPKIKEESFREQTTATAESGGEARCSLTTQYSALLQQDSSLIRDLTREDSDTQASATGGFTLG